MWNIVLSHGLDFVLSVIGLVLLAGAPKTIGWINATIDNRKIAGAMSFVAARVAVHVAARAAKVRDLKDPTKPVGEWGPAAATAQLQGVIADVIAEAPKQAAIIRKALAEGRTLEDVLRTQTEAAVEELRRSQPLQGIAAIGLEAKPDGTVTASAVAPSGPGNAPPALGAGEGGSGR